MGVAQDQSSRSSVYSAGEISPQRVQRPDSPELGELQQAHEQASASTPPPRKPSMIREDPLLAETLDLLAPQDMIRPEELQLSPTYRAETPSPSGADQSAQLTKEEIMRKCRLGRFDRPRSKSAPPPLKGGGGS